MISDAKGSFGKHLKNRQIPYQSVRGQLLTVCLMFFVVSSFKLFHDETIKVACEIERPTIFTYCFFMSVCVPVSELP